MSDNKEPESVKEILIAWTQKEIPSKPPFYSDGLIGEIEELEYKVCVHEVLYHRSLGRIAQRYLDLERFKSQLKVLQNKAFEEARAK